MKNIVHEIAEKYLNESERLMAFDKTVSFLDWSKNQEVKELEFEGINLLSLMDTIEFHSYIIQEIINFLTIKKILEEEKPKKVITSKKFSIKVKELIKNENIKIEIYDDVEQQNLHWDNINIKYNIGKFPISFNMSRKRYQKIRNLFEHIICSVFGLRFNLKNNNETILLLELYPPLYKELLSELNKCKKNIVILNRRRPAISDLNSIKTLRKTGCNLINLEQLLNSTDKKNILSLESSYSKKLQNVWSKTDFFTKLFSVEGYSLWPIIKNTLFLTYKKRLTEYLVLILGSKRIFQKINVSGILSLYEIGETEKSILKMNKNKIQSILLEHGFSILFPESSRFDVLISYPNFNDNIAVWSEHQKKYLINQHNVNPNKIFVTGSPRHDKFSKIKKSNQVTNQKTILIAPTPITEIQGFDDTTVYLKFEKLLIKILSVIKNLSDVKVIVKIHPSQSGHNKEIQNIVKKFDSTIPVYLFTPIKDLIETSDTVLTITPEGWCPSTVIMESLLLEKPTMNVILDNHVYDFEYVKANSVIAISDEGDIEKNLSEIIFNEKLRDNMIISGRKFVTNFLKDYGIASKNLAQILNSF